MRTETNYDEASRYLSKEAGAAFQHWLLATSEEQLAFGGFHDPVLKIPNTPERICDVLAKFKDEKRGGYPCMALTEFELTPDPDMFGRLLIAGGLVFVHVKPTRHTGDRYDLIAIVVNLTGKGNTAKDMVIHTTRWTLLPREIDMEELDANKILDDIVNARAPQELLAFIPLMKNGCENGTMKRWAQIVSAETDLKKRGDFALAAVFAQAVGKRKAWKKLVEGITVIDTPLVAEWKNKSRNEGLTEGEAKGILKGKRQSLEALLARHGELPPELTAKIQASENPAELDEWILTAAQAKTLASFRKQAKV